MDLIEATEQTRSGEALMSRCYRAWVPEVRSELQ
jgi:hypothetical protein